jgi:topoisomerase IA-like protein
MQIFGEESAVGENGELKPQFEPRNLGKDPKTGFQILVKIGPYGPYLELEGSELEDKSVDKEEVEKKPKKTPKKTTKASAKTAKKAVKKPKRISIPKNIDPATIDIKIALSLLTLPREVGLHPETGEKIVANIGPFGPYLLHNKQFTSVKKEDDILEIGLNRAVDLIAQAIEKKALNPKSSNNRRNQIVSFAASEIAIYSASVDDNDTVVCFLLAQLTAPRPILKTYPPVDLRSSMSPAQSASEYPTSSTLCPPRHK